MKKVDKKDISNYHKYHLFAENVKRAVESGDVDDKELFYDILSKNKHSEDFLYKVSSEEKAKEADAFLNNAFENRNSEEFANKLKNAVHPKLQRIRTIRRISGLVAAAVVVVSLVITGYLNFMNRKDDVIADNNKKNERIITPTLIVNNSKVIKLDNRSNKIIAKDYNLGSVDLNDKGEIVMQRLIVPKGFIYTVLLDDSTSVKLNAGSELSYPSKFVEDKREVHLRGEAYFEVAESTIPFIVNTDADASIRVYGTRFNLNTRIDGKMKAILMEGSIGAQLRNRSEIKMTPNQMLVLNTKNGDYSISEVIVDNYIGWINDLFLYKEASFDDLIGDLSAWYGVDFLYDEAQFKDVRITISLERNITIADMIEFLEKILKVKFIREGGNVYHIE